MKKSKFIIGGALLAFAGMVFGFTHQPKHTAKNQYTCSAVAELKPVSAIGIDLSGPISVPKIIQSEEDLLVNVLNGFSKIITKEELLKAKHVSDLISNYPSNWIEKYTSVTIKTLDGDVEKESIGENGKLTKEQKKLLDELVEGGNIEIKVNHQNKNAATNAYEDREMNVTVNVQPVQKATFPGEGKDMENYFKRNSIDFLLDKKYDVNKRIAAVFYVDEKGVAHFTKFMNQTGDEEIDGYIAALIEDMPKWNPAKDGEGKAVKQTFHLLFGGMGC